MGPALPSCAQGTVPYLPAAAWSVKTSADEKSPCRDRYGHRRRELQQIVVLSAFCQGVEIFQQVIPHKNNIFLLGRSIAYNYAQNTRLLNGGSMYGGIERLTDGSPIVSRMGGSFEASKQANAGGKIGGVTAIHQCQSPSSHLTNSTNIMETVNGRTD